MGGPHSGHHGATEAHPICVAGRPPGQTPRLNGCSNIVAFCSADPSRQAEVDEFQYMLSRLMSLLFCYSLCEISGLERESFPHLDLMGLDPDSLDFLEAGAERAPPGCLEVKPVALWCARWGQLSGSSARRTSMMGSSVAGPKFRSAGIYRCGL